MAGDKVRAFDDAYAQKLGNYIGGFNTRAGSPAQTLQVAAGASAGIPAFRKFDLGPIENTMPGNGARQLHRAGEYLVPALNAGVRYGVPLMGAKVVADGVGALYDVASQTPVFGQNPADDQSTLMVSYVR